MVWNLYKKQTETTEESKSFNEKSLLVDKQIILPPECMQRIFKYTIQISHKSTLFKLLLVNKYWSENVIPLLWKNPFRDLFPPSTASRRTPSKDPSVCYKLLRTYLACLDNEEYYLLFSRLNPLLHPFNMQIPTSINTLYNYPVYLRELSYGDLENTIQTSFMTNLKHSKNYNYQQEKYQVYLIASSLCKLFLQNSTKLQFLSFNSSTTSSSADMPIDIPNVQRYENTIKPALSNITKFQIKDIKIKSSNVILLLKHISMHSTKINQLDFNFDSNEYNTELIQSISDIIKSQRQIFEFNISNIQNDRSETIFLSLYSNHKINLKSLKLRNIHITKISLNILLNFDNLRNLYLYHCTGPNHGDTVSIFKLKKLHICGEKKDLLLRLLDQTGSSLNQLGLDLTCNKENVANVLKLCPNVIELFIINGENHDLLEWKEKIVSCSRKIIVKDLIVKCNTSSVSNKGKSKRLNDNRYCKEF